MRIVRLFDCPRVRVSGAFRSGFTVLELLVASLLLSMLVTMLTMIFNQSSIAWRTGVASVDELQDTREQLGIYHDVMDDALPGLGMANDPGLINPSSRQIAYRTVSIFRNWNGGSKFAQNPGGIATDKGFRLIDSIKWGNASEFSASDAMCGRTLSVDQPRQGASKGGFVVGVKSAGPNRIMDDDDDINTFPEEID